MGKKIAYKATHDGVAERFADPAGPQSIEVDLALLTYYDELLRAVELPILTTAKHQDANTLYLLQTVPGIGKLLSLVLLYAIHRIERFPRVQAFAVSCRLGTCTKEPKGKRSGTSGAKIGHAHLQWALSEAAVLVFRENPAAQTSLARVEKKPDQGKALPMLAHEVARAVYDMLKRPVAFDMETCFQRSGRGTDEPEASLDKQGVHLHQARDTAACLAAANAPGPLGQDTLSPAPVMGPLLSLLCSAAIGPTACVCCPSPEPDSHWTTPAR
jgi:hypothetical protein